MPANIDKAVDIMKLTSRERLTRIHENKEVDRPALKLWGFSPGMKPLTEAYRPVLDAAMKYTDLVLSGGSPFNFLAGRFHRDIVISHEDHPTSSPLWCDSVKVIRTPKGDLTTTHRYSTVGEPGYTMDYLIKEPGDIDRLLSLPYEPRPVEMDSYYEADRTAGDRGLALFNIEHAGYGLQNLCGSETISYLKADAPEKVDEILSVFASRLYNHVKAVLDAGHRPIFGWVGPELLIPPLMSPDDFENYVFKYDKPLCDLIHNAGCRVWVHCHGKVANFVSRFIDMGVDVLNPLEPPSQNGDADLNALVNRYGNTIGWEGNIEIQSLIESEREQLRGQIDECVGAGARSGRFILCPSAGFSEYINPSERYIENLLEYLTYGYEKVCAAGR